MAETRRPDDLDSRLKDLDAAGLDALIEAAQQRRRALREEAREALRREFRERAAELGVPLEELLAASPRPRAAAAEARPAARGRGGDAPVKYRGPDGATWSGRGRKPRWLSALEAEGREAEEFRV